MVEVAVAGNERDTRLAAGVYVMSITPFDSAGRLDEEALREHFRRMLAAGIGIFPASAGTGEGPLMTDAEIWRIWEIAVEESDAKQPVVAANREFPTAAQNLRFAREANARGLAAIQIYPAALGHSAVPSPAMLEAFYEEIVSESPLPIVLSSNVTTGFEVPIEVHERLLGRGAPVIGCYKNHGDMANVANFVARFASQCTVLVSGQRLLTGYALGSRGQLDNLQNVAPRLCRRFHDAFLAGDIARASHAYLRILEVTAALTAVARRTGTSKLAVYKAVLNNFGLPGGHPRRPYLSLTGAALDDLARVLDEIGLAEEEGL